MSEAAPQFFDAQGKPLTGAALAQAWHAGTAHVAEGSAVHMLDENGDLRLVPAERVQAARSKGYQPAPEKLVAEHQLQKEHGGAAEQTLAGGEGLARGATLGLSDVALNAALGDDYSKRAGERKEANPYTAGASQLVGAIAPSLVTGGEAEVASGAELAAGAAEATEGAEAVSGARAALNAGIDGARATTRIAGAPVRAVAKAGSLVEHGILSGLKGLGYTGESFATRTAAKGLAYAGAGAVEGAAFGAGDTISESYLKGEPLTSEALVASLGRNALFGGAIGGGLGTLGELAPAALGKVLPDKEKLEQFAYERAGKQLGQDFEKVGRRKGVEAAAEAKNVVAKDLLDYEIKTGPNAGKTVLQASHNPTDISLGITTARQEIGAARRGVIEGIDAAVAANPEIAAQAAPDIGEYLSRVKAEVTEPLRASKAPSIQRLADRVDRELSGLAAEHAAGGAPEFSVNVGAFDRSTMRDASFDHLRAHPEEANRLGPPRIDIYEGETPALGDGRHRMALAMERGDTSIPAEIVHYDGEGNRLSSEVRDVRLSSEPGTRPRDAVSLLPTPATAPTFQDLLKVRQDLREVFQPAAPAGGGLPPPPPKSAKYLEKAERILADYIDEKAAHALTAMGEDANGYRELTRQYSSFATMDQIAQKQAARYAKNRTVSLTDHMLGLGGFLAAIGSGNVGALSAMGMGGAASVANKMMRERGNAVLSDIAYRISKKDSLVDAAAHALATSSENLTRPIEIAQEAAGHKGREHLADSGYVPLGAVALKKDFDEARERVQQLSVPEHQQAQIAHATASVHNEYPEAAAGMAQQLLKTHQYLASALPQIQGGSPMQPLAKKPALVPPREMQRFLSKVNAALSPESVIKDIAKGRLDRDAVDTVREVYPSIFQQLQERVMQNIAANKEALPYARVVHVSDVFDFNGDTSMSPARLPGIQAAIAQINAPPPNVKAPGAPGPTKRPRPGTPKLGKPYNLPGQATAGEH